jgi:hypothetical protein
MSKTFVILTIHYRHKTSEFVNSEEFRPSCFTTYIEVFINKEG